ncbi:hypothetical protein DUNSADRAFT_18795, partial [Dunaliella salina]
MKDVRYGSPRDELIEKYASPLRVWAKLVVVFLLATLSQQYRDGTNSTGQTFLILAGCLNCWSIHEATKQVSERRPSVGVFVCNLFFCFGCLQTLYHLSHIWKDRAIPNVHLSFDVVTSLYSVTPQLIFCFNGAPTAACILFIGTHVARSSLLHFFLGKMAWHSAVLR